MTESPTPRAGFPSGIVTLLAAAALVVAFAGLGQISGIFAPAFFAFTLVLTGRPVHTWLVRHKVPRILSAVMVMLMLYVLLLAIVGGLGFALAQLTLELPKYSSTFTEMWNVALDFLDRFGINATQMLRDTLADFDMNRIVGVANQLLSSLSSVGSQVLMLLIILFFLAIDTQDVRGRMASLRNARPHLAEALSGFSLSVRKYWMVSTVFGLIVALLDVIALGFIGVPLVWTWGILSFVTNYIPNIGFILGVIPPALMALLVLGPVQALAVVIAYSVINFVLQSLVQPKFTGDAVGLNTTVTFLSLAFWASVLGPLGALLAVPLTLFVKTLVIDADPSARWMNAFITNEKPSKKSGPKGPESVPGVLGPTEEQVSRLAFTESGATVTFPTAKHRKATDEQAEKVKASADRDAEQPSGVVADEAQRTAE